MSKVSLLGLFGKVTTTFVFGVLGGALGGWVGLLMFKSQVGSHRPPGGYGLEGLSVVLVPLGLLIGIPIGAIVGMKLFKIVSKLLSRFKKK